MSDALKAILTSGPLWSALIAAVVGTVLLKDPTIPRPLIDLYVAVLVAFLGALGISGVQSLRAKVENVQTERIAKDVALRMNGDPIIKPDPGQVAFEAYADMVGRVTWDGKPIPIWRELSPKVRQGWNAAAAASRKL